jgi:imidazolonepropionase-like amidohydrolase
MHRVTTRWGPLLLASLFLLCSASAQEAPGHNDVVITNAYVMTVTHGNLKNGSAAFGEMVDAPASATVINAGGKYLTPGIIDSHSHIALDDDVNEAPAPSPRR